MQNTRFPWDVSYFSQRWKVKISYKKAHGCSTTEKVITSSILRITNKMVLQTTDIIYNCLLYTRMCIRKISQ
jgi:hypothetical protein